MSIQKIISEAHVAVANAIRDKQYRAIPYILSGYATAAASQSMAARVLYQNPSGFTLRNGSVYASSPTKIVENDEVEIRAPKNQIVAHPCFDIKKDVSIDKMEEVILSIPVCIDRMFLALLTSHRTHRMAAINMRYDQQFTYALVGSQVSTSQVGDSARISMTDYGGVQNSCLNDREVIFAQECADELIGEISFSPVTPKPTRASGLSYCLHDNLLEIGLTMPELSIAIHRPDLFVVASF